MAATHPKPLQLRPAQAEILKYRHGRLAISAVPGSGKTFTLSLLAAQLIADGRVNPDANQQILIVTFLNSSVDNFKNSIRKRLDDLELPPTGFDVRTLHSLGLEIVRQASGGLGLEAEPDILDEIRSRHALTLAMDGWITDHSEFWYDLLDDQTPQGQSRWRSTILRTAAAFIRTAKNERYTPEQILQRSRGAKERGIGGAEEPPPSPPASQPLTSPLLPMMAGIYGRYQNILERQGALDFNDLIWTAVDLLENRPDLTEELRLRWPFVLEDEAQDSVPLQEKLLEQLTGAGGNWVRVGDPNQAITSTFTAAHPRFFNAFIDRPDVRSQPLPNSGRCAPLIFSAANTMLHWVCDKHPVSEVRQHAFRRQDILPTPPGDAQPNPANDEAGIHIKVYRHREDEELPGVARLAVRYAQERPSHALAVLVPTNNIGYALAEQLDALDADYDNLLRNGGREREIAAAMHAILAVLADPLDRRALTAAFESLRELGHPAALGPDEADLPRIQAILRSIRQPENLLFPTDGRITPALPANVATETDETHLERFAHFLQRLFDLRQLPVDDLALALGDELFATGDIHESDLAIAYQIAAVLRRWRDTEPDWRLPELAQQLADVAAGRRNLPLTTPSDLGYEPLPGRITLATQHSAKGLEWDAVFLVGIDGYWIPGTLEAYFQGVDRELDVDLTAEIAAQLRQLMEGDAELYHGRTATESAHIDIICERLRLLYVGLTRAKRFLHISRSRATRAYSTERPAEPATVMGVLYQYLKKQRAGE